MNLDPKKDTDNTIVSTEADQGEVNDDSPVKEMIDK